MEDRARRLSEMSTDALKNVTLEWLYDVDDVDDENEISKGNDDTYGDELPPIFRDGNFVMDDGMIILKRHSDRDKRNTRFSRIREGIALVLKKDENNQNKSDQSNNVKLFHNAKKFSLTKKLRSQLSSE
eukprot:CAMPEP_0172502266 /NCGR_PEP_ID=MMETSP1066-20121228/158324_1 /TAXON_ID=671091 /ORGANISM="Coscinodiscus wailesii, Strain CCMP2513" /LENGTH=128 /DNA_ID=CAMNT_0013277459 /DNA_START=156 /DNA_END=542 /DNA_ORIENTATION=-